MHPKPSKPVNTNRLELIYNDNEPNDLQNVNNIHTLEHIYSKNLDPSARSDKLLGVHLDENLTFNHHYSLLSNKLACALYFIRRVKNLLPQNALLTLYYSLFHCHLLYCPNIIGSTSDSNIMKVAKLQHKAILLITFSPNRAHPPLFSTISTFSLSLTSLSLTDVCFCIPLNIIMPYQPLPTSGKKT
jgi:hypothetical protein